MGNCCSHEDKNNLTLEPGINISMENSRAGAESKTDPEHLIRIAVFLQSAMRVYLARKRVFVIKRSKRSKNPLNKELNEFL